MQKSPPDISWDVGQIAPLRSLSPEMFPPFPMAKRALYRASDLRPEVKARISAELAAAHQSGTNWPRLSEQYQIPIATCRRWASRDMSSEIQHQRHANAGRHSKLTDAEVDETLLLARERRDRHEVVDTKWTKETRRGCER
jgi:hypothetical protein